MRVLITAMSLLLTLVGCPCFAQSIVVSGPELTDAGNERFISSLDVTGGEGTFDTFEIEIESSERFIQVGTPASRLAIGSGEDSGFNRMLDDPLSWSYGLSDFGVDASTDTPSLVSGTFASLGSNNASNQGNYDIAQIVMSPGGGGVYSYAFFDEGLPVGPTGARIPFGVPEPSTLALVVLSSFAMLANRNLRGMTR
ncbi:MAG: PEP-CTERM sorting domain-containing protein [Planctomycetota bacterium]